MNPRTERRAALEALTTCLQEHIPLSHVFEQFTLSPFSKVLCFGVCRHYFRLQTIALSLLKKPPKPFSIWVAVLMGLFELYQLNHPDYAVVKETVNLLDQPPTRWARGLVNAILRRFCRERSSILAALASNPLFIYGHPQWFLDELKQDWPEHWQFILSSNDQHPPMSLRVNIRQTTIENYLHQLTHAQIQAHVFSSDQHSDVKEICNTPTSLSTAKTGISSAKRISLHCLLLDDPCSPTDLPGFNQGDITIQDAAAQYAAYLLDLKPGLRLLDACCAPGGKTTHCLEIMPDLTYCLAIDRDSKRLVRVKDNLDRLHLMAHIQQADACQPQTWWDGKPFDRILLDAPCSATGIIRRHPDIKCLRNPEEIDAVVQIQQQLLEALWALLTPGGRLVYATCSVLKRENEQQIAWFLSGHADCRVIDIAECGVEIKPKATPTYGWQILPGEQHMDGFYYAILEKLQIQ